MKIIFKNAKIVFPDKVQEGSIVVQDGKIQGFNLNCNAENTKIIDLQGAYILAGFIDIHVHGGGGADFMDGSIEAFETAIQTHLSHGTTTIYPTTMSATMEEIEKTFAIFRSFKNSGKCVAKAPGLHLEGPFLNPKMCGAQRQDLIICPQEKHVRFLQENADIIARITCAPEMEGVMQMAAALSPYNIQFSMGHTNATYAQAEEGAKNGFSSVTHLYCATSGFHKVDQKVHIGVTQAAYGLENLYAELIGDGCHVPKELLNLVVKFKGVEKVCLVTDAMRAAGTKASESYLGSIAPENRVIIDDGVAKLPDKSSFAGSIGTMDRAFKFAVENAGLSLHQASKLVSLTPATLMGIDGSTGSIAVGKDADLVVMNKDLYVQQVYVQGERVV